MKKATIKLLTIPKRRMLASVRRESAAQCCAKASRLIAGCHD